MKKYLFSKVVDGIKETLVVQGNNEKEAIKAVNKEHNRTAPKVTDITLEEIVE